MSDIQRLYAKPTLRWLALMGIFQGIISSGVIYLMVKKYSIARLESNVNKHSQEMDNRFHDSLVKRIDYLTSGIDSGQIQGIIHSKLSDISTSLDSSAKNNLQLIEQERQKLIERLDILNKKLDSVADNNIEVNKQIKERLDKALDSKFIEIDKEFDKAIKERVGELNRRLGVVDLKIQKVDESIEKAKHYTIISKRMLANDQTIWNSNGNYIFYTIEADGSIEDHREVKNGLRWRLSADRRRYFIIEEADDGIGHKERVRVIEAEQGALDWTYKN